MSEPTLYGERLKDELDMTLDRSMMDVDLYSPIDNDIGITWVEPKEDYNIDLYDFNGGWMNGDMTYLDCSDSTGHDPSVVRIPNQYIWSVACAIDESPHSVLNSLEYYSGRFGIIAVIEVVTEGFVEFHLSEDDGCTYVDTTSFDDTVYPISELNESRINKFLNQEWRKQIHD